MINSLLNIFKFVKTYIYPAIQTNINTSEVDTTSKNSEKKDIFAQIDDIQKTYEGIPVYKYPVPNHRVTCSFGWRILTYDGVVHKNFHSGVDLIGDNYNLIAPEDCIIKKIVPRDTVLPCLFEKKDGQWVKVTPPEGKKWNDGSWGWTPYIVLIGIHSKNMYVLKHCVTYKNVMDKISVGNKIGEYGNYGYSMGAHCHLEIYKYNESLTDFYDKDKPNNPVDVLKNLQAV